MGTAKYCDRCDVVVRGAIPLGGYLQARNNLATDNYELCSDCWSAFKTFMVKPRLDKIVEEEPCPK